jgi:hypothetical protein
VSCFEKLMGDRIEPSRGPHAARRPRVWGAWVRWCCLLLSNLSKKYFQSTEYLYSLFHKLGTVEMEDQISVTKKLLQKFLFLDSNRVGIWGHSYGGYATLKIMSIDTGKTYQLFLAEWFLVFIFLLNMVWKGNHGALPFCWVFFTRLVWVSEGQIKI